MGRACRAASARGEGGYGSAASRVPARQWSFPYPAFRPQNDCQPDRAMDEQPLHLERGMTHDALKRYLESAPSLAELASVLLPGVDSDSIINLHAGCAQPDSAILAQSFLLANKQEKTAPRITLAIRLHSFLLSEKEAARLAKNTKKSSRTAEKSTNLEAAMHAEKKSRVTAEPILASRTRGTSKPRNCQIWQATWRGEGGMASSCWSSFFAQWGGMIHRPKREHHHP